jgi:hypothetical protein
MEHDEDDPNRTRTTVVEEEDEEDDDGEGEGGEGKGSEGPWGLEEQGEVQRQPSLRHHSSQSLWDHCRRPTETAMHGIIWPTTIPYLPCRKWLSRYTYTNMFGEEPDLWGDVIAGLIVGIVAVPQAMAVSGLGTFDLQLTSQDVLWARHLGY